MSGPSAAMIHNSTGVDVTGGELINTGPGGGTIVNKIYNNLNIGFPDVTGFFHFAAKHFVAWTGSRERDPVQISDIVPPDPSSLPPVSSIADKYTRCMLECTAGYPLYTPQPFSELSMEYPRNGVNIGDVGFVREDGTFDFLFNICPSQKFSINPPNLPDSFCLETPNHSTARVQESLPLNKCVIPRTVKITSGEYICEGSEGAILELPEGAIRNEAIKIKLFEALAKLRGVQWYRYAMARGRNISNGSLYLVTSFTKCTQWGIAVFDRPCSAGEGLTFVRSPFGWKGSRVFTTKVANTNQGDTPNQCVFLRGYKIKLRQDIYDNLYDDEPRNSDSGLPSSSPQAGISRLTLTRQPANRIRGGGGTDLWSKILAVGKPSTPTTKAIVKKGAEVVLHPDFNSSPFHPSDVINSTLLSQNPDAKIALTHDDVWCDLMRDNFPTLNYATLINIACSYTSMVDEYGCVYFEKISDSSNVVDDKSCQFGGTKTLDPQESKASSKPPNVRVEGTLPELPREGSSRHKTKTKLQDIVNILLPHKAKVGKAGASVNLPMVDSIAKDDTDKQAGQPAIQISEQIGEVVLPKKFPYLQEAKRSDDHVERLGGAGGLVVTPGYLHYASDSSGTPEVEDAEIYRNQRPNFKVPFQQGTTYGPSPDFRNAQSFNIISNNNSPFRNINHIGVPGEYYDGNLYDIPILKESVSFKAIHDSYAQDPTSRVHPGTRQYILKRIRNWIDTPGAKERILWLHGPVGVGKSAIAQVIARSCAQETLAATFFFYRSDSGRNDGNRLCTTLAWQFAFSIPATKDALIHSLIERPDIPMKEVEMQFQELIVKPFLTSKRFGLQVSAPVVIIDAVDECSDDGLQRRILKIIGNAVRDDRVPLRFLICSRSEAHIQDVFDIFQSLTLSLDLAELNDANRDIEKYLTAEFSRIATEQGLSAAWPGQQIIQEFVYKASGQFAYASTVIKRVGDEYSSAETQLDVIRGLRPPSTISPFAELDELYKEILRRQRDPVFLNDFLSLVIGRSGINDAELHRDDAMLMNVSEKELHRKLRGMRSLLKFELYIDLHHRSFLDFLQDPSRSGQYHISKQAGTRRYLDLITGSLVRYTSTVMEGHDDHKTHFSPQFYNVTSSYPSQIVLPAKEWQEALQPLLDLWNKLLTLPNFRCTWDLLPCKRCTGFRTIRDLLLHLAFRLEGSYPDFNCILTPEALADGSEGTYSSVTPSINTEHDTNTLEKDLNACLSSLLHHLRRRTPGISLDTDTIQLVQSLLRFDQAEIVVRLRSILDAQNLVDVIDELSNTKYVYGPGISCKAVHLALEIYARAPVLPRSLFSKGIVGPYHTVYGTFQETEVLFQTALMYRLLDPSYIVQVSWVYDKDKQRWLVDDKVNENNELLSQWRKRSKPSSARIRVMLEVAKAIRYFHSIGIVLHDHIRSDHIFLDSEFHVRVLFLGLLAHYVKVTPMFSLNQEWLSYEVNVFFFGCLFYEMTFDVEISFLDGLDDIRDTVAKRPSEPEISDDAWQLIQRCCAEEPKSRPTMNDIVQEMEAWDIT